MRTINKVREKRVVIQLRSGTFQSLDTYFYDLTGFSSGAYALCAPLYVSELSENSIRGALASVMQLMSTLGVAFVDGLNIGGVIHWVTISGICISIPGAQLQNVATVWYN